MEGVHEGKLYASNPCIRFGEEKNSLATTLRIQSLFCFKKLLVATLVFLCCLSMAYGVLPTRQTIIDILGCFVQNQHGQNKDGKMLCGGNNL